MRQIRCADWPGSQKEEDLLQQCNLRDVWMRLFPYILCTFPFISFLILLNLSLSLWLCCTLQCMIVYTKQSNCRKNSTNFPPFKVWSSVFLWCFCHFNLYLIEQYNGSSHNMSDLSWFDCLDFFSLILPSALNWEKRLRLCVGRMQDYHQHAHICFVNTERKALF